MRSFNPPTPYQRRLLYNPRADRWEEWVSDHHAYTYWSLKGGLYSMARHIQPFDAHRVDL